MDFSVLSKCGGPLGALSIPYKALLAMLAKVEVVLTILILALEKEACK